MSFRQDCDAKTFSLLHVAISVAIAEDDCRLVFSGNLDVAPAVILDCITNLYGEDGVAPLVEDYRWKKTISTRSLCRTPTALRCIQDILRTESTLKQRTSGYKRKLCYVYDNSIRR